MALNLVAAGHLQPTVMVNSVREVGCIHGQAGATASTTTENSRASRELYWLCSQTVIYKGATRTHAQGTDPRVALGA